MAWRVYDRSKKLMTRSPARKEQITISLSRCLWSGNGARRFRDPGGLNPKIINEFAKVDVVLEVDGLNQESVRAEAIGAVHVPKIVRRSQDDDGDAPDFILPAQPTQNFKSVQAGHFEIEKNQIGNGKFVAVGVLASAGQVSDSLFAIANDMERII
jgi:hypothetical protein